MCKKRSKYNLKTSRSVLSPLHGLFFPSRERKWDISRLLFWHHFREACSGNTSSLDLDNQMLTIIDTWNMDGTRNKSMWNAPLMVHNQLPPIALSLFQLMVSSIKSDWLVLLSKAVFLASIQIIRVFRNDLNQLSFPRAKCHVSRIHNPRKRKRDGRDVLP